MEANQAADSHKNHVQRGRQVNEAPNTEEHNTLLLDLIRLSCVCIVLGVDKSVAWVMTLAFEPPHGEGRRKTESSNVSYMGLTISEDRDVLKTRMRQYTAIVIIFQVLLRWTVGGWLRRERYI